MRCVSRFDVVALVLAVAISCPSFAFAAEAPVAAETSASRAHEQALKDPSGKFVQELGDKAIQIMADKSMSHENRKEAFSKMLGETFDLKTIGRFVIGRVWNSTSPEKQTEYMQLFKDLVLKNYGERMTLYTGEGFKVVGTRPESDIDTIVMSHITHPDGSKPTAIDWRIRSKDGKMGVIDVVVEGVSLSITQKQEYASVLQNSGGNIDGLLKAMRSQVQTASSVAKK